MSQTLPINSAAATGDNPEASNVRPLPDRSVAEMLADLIQAEMAASAGKTAALEPFRIVLLRQRAAGASIRVMVGALRRVGVAIGEETLRLWFRRQGVRKGGKKESPRTAPVVSPVTIVRRAPTVAPIVQGPRVARTII
jgi:hypothetical protein